MTVSSFRHALVDADASCECTDAAAAHKRYNIVIFGNRLRFGAFRMSPIENELDTCDCRVPCERALKGSYYAFSLF